MDFIRGQRPYLKTKDIESDKDLDRDFREWREAQLKVENSPIINELTGVRINMNTCKSCKFKHYSFNHFHDLSLDINDKNYNSQA